jgi:hypothetical protein
MRHRAAIGLSEETDALIVVVSEETGDISVAVGGKLQRGMDPDALREYLSKTLAPPARRGWGVTDAVRRFVSGLFVREPRTESSETFSEAPEEDKAIPEERAEGES